ncbi:MAG: hypothetical protein LBR33_01490 [Propionibacteriaceae bacterium]|jgi:hypothetical protein|nr:hypothetical protein [Propionibacteriaceae bacterium]
MARQPAQKPARRATATAAAPAPAKPQPAPAPPTQAVQSAARTPAAVAKPPATAQPPQPKTHLTTPTLLGRFRLVTVVSEIVNALIGSLAVAFHVDGSGAEDAFGVLAIIVAGLTAILLVTAMVVAAKRTHRVITAWLLVALVAVAGLVVAAIMLTATGTPSALHVIFVLVTGAVAVACTLAGFRARLEEYR